MSIFSAQFWTRRPDVCAEFSSSSYDFTSSLYHAILGYVKEENFCMSPLALEVLLGLTRSGAKDNTAQEIKTALVFPLNPRDIEAVIKNVNPLLQKGKNFLYIAANKIFVDQDYSIKKEFRDQAQQQYEVDIESVDFRIKRKAIEAINELIGLETREKITGILRPESLDDYICMLAISGVYFKGSFFKTVLRETSTKKKFYKNNEDFVEVEVMEKTGIYSYVESEELAARIVEIPFETDTVSMVVVLPKEKTGLGYLENHISKVFRKARFKQNRVNVVMPKFRIHTSIEFKKALQRMGCRTPFTENSDLSGFLDQTATLRLTDCVQKAVVNIVQGSSEGPISGKAMMHQKSYRQEVIPFVIDHPFLFYIKSKDIIIFAGRVVNPC